MALEGASTAGLDPVGTALNTITGLASGGPSSAYSGGGNQAGAPINIGGNQGRGDGAGFLEKEYYGVPMVVYLSVLGLIGLKLMK